MTVTTIAHFISGHKVSGSSSRAQDVFNPATGAITGRVSLSVNVNRSWPTRRQGGGV